jgi:hypothetical protein
MSTKETGKKNVRAKVKPKKMTAAKSVTGELTFKKEPAAKAEIKKTMTKAEIKKALAEHLDSLVKGYGMPAGAMYLAEAAKMSSRVKNVKPLPAATIRALAELEADTLTYCADADQMFRQLGIKVGKPQKPEKP